MITPSRFIRSIACLAALLMLAGCGAVQTVKEATVNTTRAIFYTQTLRMKVDLVAREGINSDDKDHPMSVVVRMYQLKDAKALDAAPYEQMLTNDVALLRDSLIESKSVVLRPGATISIDEPLDKSTQAVAVVAFFRKEDKDGQWRVVIPRDALSDDKPVKLAVVGYALRRDPPAKG